MVLALAGVGLVTGFINTLAGGGSALSLPMLMFLGLPANIANGTNRIAILMQSVVGANTFYRKKVLDFKTDYKLTIPAVVGSVIGAMFAVEINTELLEKIIAGLMVVMLLMVIFKPEAWVKEHAGKTEAKPTVMQYLIFFAIGFYGGFIQMGVGFFLLAGLVLGGGYNLVRANAVKILIVLVFTLFSIGIFIAHGQVDLLAGFILAAGSMAGAWLGAHLSIKGGAKLVRYVLILAMIAVILNLFGVFG